MEGPGENSPRSGFEGAGAPRQPHCMTLGRLAPRHYALRRRPRCPASHGPPARRTLPVSRRAPAPAVNGHRKLQGFGHRKWQGPPATGIAPKIRSLLFRGTRPHGGSRSRTVRSPRNLLLSPKAVEATAMVSSRDRLSQGPGSGQMTAYSDTYGRHRMPVDRMGRPRKHRRPEDGCPRFNHRAKTHVVRIALSRALAPLGVEGRLAETESRPRPSVPG